MDGEFSLYGAWHFMRQSFLTSTRFALALAAGSIASTACFADAGLMTDKLGKKIDALVFTGLDGKPVPMNAMKDKKAIVITFLSFDCPVSNDYSTTLTHLHKQYADKGVVFAA